ncbi:protein ALP1-like [Quercus suber]|uniref:protein ALP1-like n=1 Tax=Quercus suber TaxID=58331 RepID=UPI0032DF87E9
MASGNDWWQAVQEYDFDDAYFNDVGSSNDCEENDDDWPDSEFEREEEVEFNLVNPIVGEMYAYMQRHYDKQPMRTSALTGKAYMDEVTEGNPAKCYEMFRMTHELLLHLVDELAEHGYLRDGHGDLNATQAVAMLLYILGHNTRFRCVLDRFQHSIETVCRHVCKALQAVHHYAKHLIKPDQNVIGLPEHLQVNKYWPWFERYIGAIDGTHVSARPPANATQAHRDCKSLITTNVLCVCDMDMQFTFVHGGWEGSANDSRVFEEAISDQKHGFPWPPRGSYYLVDSGLPIGTSFFPPHKLTRYHAQEFQLSGRRITSKKELYNYRHSSLRMVIERPFGVLKTRFPILNLMPNFKPIRQHYVVIVCCALHNFIRMNNRSDELFRTIGESVGEGSATNNEGSGDAEVSTSSATQRHVLEMSRASKRAIGQFRDNITDIMWDDYVARGNVR